MRRPVDLGKVIKENRVLVLIGGAILVFLIILWIIHCVRGNRVILFDEVVATTGLLLTLRQSKRQAMSKPGLLWYNPPR